MCLVLISVAALNYQHLKGLLSFSLEVLLFPFSPSIALGPQLDSGGIEPPLQLGRDAQGLHSAASSPVEFIAGLHGAFLLTWSLYLLFQCPLPGALLYCHCICE